ncbi:ribonuclease H2 subunit C isoform X1 [Cygnus olor]|uniref:ribonuclease H2 subunit C isoform X1 n=1 Tax=Cygnus olor TaxID=8869 RepID=UPI001ADE0CA4|nr:ribonuclease H2 subunit C isoform X1 [Cygnus olor]
MAAPVRVRAAPGAARERLRAQLLPCRVGRDGPAPVGAFLRAQPGPGGELWASFRGRRLGGRELPLPPGYRGELLRREPPPGDDEEDPKEQWVTVTATFGAITEWGADAVPPPAGGLAQALQWGPLAHASHAPVPDDSEEEAEP